MSGNGAGPDGPVLYHLVCGSPVAVDAGVAVAGAQRRGWRVCVLASPSGLRFIDTAALAAATGYPVRSEYKHPRDPDLLPPADAILVAPATCNTVNKWAAGIADTLVLGILTEAVGLPVPIVAVPFSNRAQASHPAFRENVARLRSWGVRMLFGDDVCKLHDPGTGEQHIAEFPWELALDTVADALPATAHRPGPG